MNQAYIFGLAFLLIIALLGVTFQKSYLQGFKNWSADTAKPIDNSGSAVPGGSEVIMEPSYEKPFATTPIQSVDDYEYNLVFYNEGDKALTKSQRDYLMAQYPMDWSTQPPSSAAFQKGMAKLKEAFENKPAPPPASLGEVKRNPYKEIDGSQMVPPDTLSIEQKEKEILATYTPKKPGELTTYDASDAKELISKIYDAKGLVPDFMEKKPGVFVVTGTRRKDEKVVYEDEDVAPATSGAVASSGERPTPETPVVPNVGEGAILVPPVGYETSVGLDPFFTAGSKTRDGKWDYTSWTPGLERMFAPTEARTNWY